MKIAIIDMDNLKNPFWGAGQARATLEVGKRLVALGHDVVVYTSKYPGYRDYTQDGVKYIHKGIESKYPRLTNLVFLFLIPLIALKIKADVILENFNAPTSVSFAPLFTRVPLVGMPTMFEAAEFSKKYHLPFHWVEAWGSKFYRYFLAFSESTKSKMQRYNPRVVSRIIPNGVSEEFFDVKTSEGDYILFLGRIDNVQKGLDLLVEAYSQVSERLPKLVIAGNGREDNIAELKAEIKKKNLEHKVQFVGRVDGEEKVKLLANCLFGVYPSRFEDFPLIPLEFAAFGKPLVCFDIKGVSWVPAAVAVKAQSFDVASLSQALLRVAEDSQLRFAMQKDAKAFANEYGWNSIAKQYEDFFQDVIKIDSLREGKIFA